MKNRKLVENISKAWFYAEEMNKRIQLPAKRLLGLSFVGPSSFNDQEGAGSEFADRIWHEFIDALLQANIPLNQDLFGVSWPADEHTPPQEIHYFCGFESSENIKGFETLEVAGGGYFECHAEVPASNLDSAFQQAYLEALPASGLTSREGQHLEIYGEEYDPDSPTARFRILIPVL